MEFFIDDKETESRFQEIFKQILILKNGETHSEMKKMGLHYQKSLGATIVNLRELSKQYDCSHLLAHKLWTKGYRETKILASLLEEPEKVSLEQTDRWLTESETNEILEQVAMNLFSKLPNVFEQILNWLESRNYKKILCAIICTRQLAIQKEVITSEFLNDFIAAIPQNIDEHYLRTQLSRCLGRLVRLDAVIAEKISAKVQHLQAMDENWKEVWDELKYELNL